MADSEIERSRDVIKQRQRDGKDKRSDWEADRIQRDSIPVG